MFVSVNGDWILFFWFVLGCVACGVYCHAECAHKFKSGLRRVLNIAVHLADGALCIEWGMGGS